MVNQNVPLITVVGKIKQTKLYRGLPGYNVFPESAHWTPKSNRRWLDEAIARGDLFLIASNEYTGEFLNELIYLLQKLTGSNS